METVGFFRKKSPVWGICVSIFLSFVLFCLLLTAFVARSAISLINNMDTAVTTMLEDKSFRTKIARTIQSFTPEDSISTGEITQLMDDEKIAEAIGEFSSAWMNDVMENETDPMDALAEVLKDPQKADQYENAIQRSLAKLGKDDEALLEGANKLAEKYEFEAIQEGSSNLEIAVAVMEGTRGKLTVDLEEITEYVVETRAVVHSVSIAIPMFSTALFTIFNLVVIGIFYGLFLLLTRHLVKPGLCLGIPYVLTGVLLLFVSSLDLATIVGNFVDIPKEYQFVFGVLVSPVFTSGLIAVIIGGSMVVGSSTGLILLKTLKKEAVPAPCGAPAADIPPICREDRPAQGDEIASAVEETPEATKTPVCPNCGEPIDGTLFCTNCGTKLEE